MRNPRTAHCFSSSYFQIFLVLLLVGCGGVAVDAQTIFGRISGTVKDASGGVVPNASITVTNEATNLARTGTTDESGFYTITNLPVGSYRVSVEQKGYKKALIGGSVLSADERLTVDVILEPGDISENVEITSAVGESVNTTSGEVARVVDRRQVQNLALNGRNYMQLVTLVPGAAILDENQLALREQQ